MTHAIETVSLTKRFRRVDAVHDLNLHVAEGATYALMGPNGAGKTTLIKLLMNLLRPTAGRSLLLGGESGRLRGQPLESLGYVSENQKLPEWFTVEELLRYWRPFYPTWDVALEAELVKRFELPRKQKLKHLSRGVRMKAALASVLAYRPRLIVLDEPLSGLDPLVRNDLVEVLLERAGGTTVLISSHDLAEIESFASHVGYMQGGRLRLSEPLASVRARFRSVQVAGAAPLAAPEAAPAEWQQLAVEGASARWIETGYDPVESVGRIHRVFGTVRVETSPMSLREVFLAMSRKTRAGAAQGSGH